MSLGVLLVVALLLGFVGRGAAQQPPPQSLPEQLATCTSLLRVKQDLVCRCDQSEQLAAALLRRAEKAEQQLDEWKAAQMSKASADGNPPPEKKD
jgi:hypothetical protein